MDKRNGRSANRPSTKPIIIGLDEELFPARISSFTRYHNKISLVNSIEAEAAFQPFYATVSIMGTSLYDSPNRGYKAQTVSV